MSQSQDFENHAKIVPAFHFFVLPILTLNLGWSIYHLIHAFSADTLISALLAMALIVLAFCARIFALTVQDRVIRLEMRQHLMQLLPAELRPRIPEFTVNQLVSLRFASDAELPALARRVLDEKITDRKSIKRLVQTWQPDLLRA
jgi:uncharacterized protein DUF6526